MDNVIHGFCLYVTSYTGHYLYTWTLNDLIKYGINKYDDKKREESLKEYRKNLRKKLLEERKNPSDSYHNILESAMNQWPYLGSYCRHTISVDCECGMCINGCDFN